MTATKNFVYHTYMNPEAKDKLNEILQKRSEELNKEDKAFLRARRSYLNKMQTEEYKDILHEKSEEPKDQTPAKGPVNKNATSKTK